MYLYTDDLSYSPTMPFYFPIFFILQHLRVPNRDHLIQWQGQRVPRRELRGGGRVCGLSFHPPRVDQHSTQGSPHVVIIQCKTTVTEAEPCLLISEQWPSPPTPVVSVSKFPWTLLLLMSRWTTLWGSDESSEAIWNLKSSVYHLLTIGAKFYLFIL